MSILAYLAYFEHFYELEYHFLWPMKSPWMKKWFFLHPRGFQCNNGIHFIKINFLSIHPPWRPTVLTVISFSPAEAKSQFCKIFKSQNLIQFLRFGPNFLHMSSIFQWWGWWVSGFNSKYSESSAFSVVQSSQPSLIISGRAQKSRNLMLTMVKEFISLFLQSWVWGIQLEKVATLIQKLFDKEWDNIIS